MATSRTTYKYHYKLGNRIVHTGITKDLDRREAEHRRHEGWERGHITQVGVRTTPEAAREWEQDQRQSGQTNRPVTTTRSPHHRTRPAACRRAQGRRYSRVGIAVRRIDRYLAVDSVAPLLQPSLG